jgi:hypothetical protein
VRGARCGRIVSVRRWRSVATRLLAGLALVVCSRATVQAQTTEFTLSTGAVTFPTPTAANYSTWPPSASGPVTDSVAVPFEVSRTSTGWRIATVLIRCTAVAGGKACGDIEWRNGATGAWQTLTFTDAEVETRWLWIFGSNFGWSNTLWLRVRLRPGDPIPSVMSSQIALSLDVYRP